MKMWSISVALWSVILVGIEMTGRKFREVNSVRYGSVALLSHLSKSMFMSPPRTHSWLSDI